ncbi:MAG: TIGR00159 family protein [Chloroflexaceae bacterium]|nr:TIGR00159 family protein [Chloroflexaceae bacterium]
MPELTRLWNRLNPLIYPYALIDILVVALIFFWLMEAIRGTRAVRLLWGVIILLTISLLLSTTLNQLVTLEWLLQNSIQPLLIAIPIIFQPELRRALETLGRTGSLFRFSFTSSTNPELLETVNIVSRAAAQLSKQGIGGLMVIERSMRLQEYADKGVLLDSRLAVPLILNIFYPNSPLHDMAVIIRDNRILAANVVLPLSEDIVGHRRYGTRHRAAKGITEQSDAITVVISEETGEISLVNDGRMVSYLNEARLRVLLARLLQVPLDGEDNS